ncbi:phage terminase large subunit family protein [Konateibacter massiliensis]|uniref:phage terminase large subunit family protein n=1 Tax=Konateibacter massiliensis TaxID=2002841 RepID=UPI000C14F2A7|nr:terminase [Konateibacter massiliensis]
MAVSKQNMKKLEWLWSDDNKIAWIETFIKIADKNGDIVPFILTDEQRRLVEGLEHQNIVSKSRQLGISVCTVALSIRECVVHDNSTCVLISHNQTSTNAVFDKLKQQFYSLPDWLRPQLIQNNRQALTFANGSSVVCMTAGNKDVGRGSTYNAIVHMSEFAFWKDQERQLKSIMQAVSSSATVIIESTSNGYNNYSSLFLQAKNNENAFKAFFFNWINGGALFKDQYKESVRLYKAQHNGHMVTIEDYDEEEKMLAELGMTPEQAVWRRDKISISGIDAFHVEYPSTPEESFLATGSSVFDNTKVIKLQQVIAERKIVPLKLDKIVGLPTSLTTYVQNRSLSIWAIPKVGEKYWVGVDVSEGLGGKHDYSTMFIMDKDGRQVAEFKNNKIKPYLFADIVNDVGRWYNKALLTVEKASGGHSVIERLRYDKHYMNMTKYKTYDEFKRAVWNVGFDTNNKTKSIAVNDAREWFDKGMLDINSNQLLEEMKTFIAEENGSFNAVTGSHDDLISAMWLCIQGMKQGFWYPF